MMRFLLIILIAFSCSQATMAAYQLGAQHTDASYSKSNKGVIGIRFEKIQGDASPARIVEVYPGTPADRAGIREGDSLGAVDGIAVAPLSVNQIYSLIAGPPGTPRQLGIERCFGWNNCQRQIVPVTLMDMNQIPSDNIFRIYRYGW